jgi:hypothetical protein
MKATWNILIDFFATVYDLVIEFFALQYDLVLSFIIFLGEYLKWITSISSNSTAFPRHAEEPIKIHSQNHFDVR